MKIRVAVRTFSGSCGLGLVPGGGNGITRNIRNPGIQSKSISPLKTSIEILDDSRRRNRPIPEAIPHAPAANKIRATRTIKYFKKCTWFTGMRRSLEEANSVISPARSASTLPNITTSADTVTPTDRFIPHPARVSAKSIHYCRKLLIELASSSLGSGPVSGNATSQEVAPAAGLGAVGQEIAQRA